MSSTTTPRLLTPGEVARMFHVDPKTVSRWADAGKLPTVLTLGGHRRFPANAVQAALSVGDTAGGWPRSASHG